jgi:protein-S-isoprenylcysteine O-methyltransferase Ste14
MLGKCCGAINEQGAACHTIYAAYTQCPWDGRWEMVRHPFLVFVGMCGCLALIVWLNIREGRLPKL